MAQARWSIAALTFGAACACLLAGAARSAPAPAAPERHATLPNASPDGTHLAFTRDVPHSRSEVWVVNPDGSQPRLVSSVDEGGEVWSWRGGGSEVVFEQRARDTVMLRSVSLSGGEPRTVVAMKALAVRLSHDGRHLAWVRGAWTSSRLFVSEADGSNPRALTDSSGGWFNVAWSPDDRTIAVAHRDSTRALQVWSIDVRTGAGHALTAFSPADGSPQWPAWSPDGRQIAIHVGRYDRQDPSKSESDIWVMHADGSDAHRISRRTGTWMDETPTWLRDGKHIAYQSTRTGPFEIWVMDADGGNARQVTR